MCVLNLEKPREQLPAHICVCSLCTRWHVCVCVFVSWSVRSIWTHRISHLDCAIGQACFPGCFSLIEGKERRTKRMEGEERGKKLIWKENMPKCVMRRSKLVNRAILSAVSQTTRYCLTSIQLLGSLSSDLGLPGNSFSSGHRSFFTVRLAAQDWQRHISANHINKQPKHAQTLLVNTITNTSRNQKMLTMPKSCPFAYRFCSHMQLSVYGDIECNRNNKEKKNMHTMT